MSTTEKLKCRVRGGLCRLVALKAAWPGPSAPWVAPALASLLCSKQVAANHNYLAQGFIGAFIDLQVRMPFAAPYRY